MGIYISALNCKQLYDIDISCGIQVDGNETYPNTTIIGGYLPGQIPADPDIAGIEVSKIYSKLCFVPSGLMRSRRNTGSLFLHRYYNLCSSPQRHNSVIADRQQALSPSS